jgi:hypothetical protein
MWGEEGVDDANGKNLLDDTRGTWYTVWTDFYKIRLLIVNGMGIEQSYSAKC